MAGLVPAIRVFLSCRPKSNTWMPATSAGMTTEGVIRLDWNQLSGNPIMRIIVTGGAGFIGSALCRLLIGESEHVVLNIDKLTYAGTLESLRSVADDPRYRFVRADICDRAAIDALIRDYKPDAIVHLAAESHVDRSITASSAFVDPNIVGTLNLLEACRQLAPASAVGHECFRFIHVPTDEVYGSLGATGRFCEETAYRPSSPYAATN